MTVNKKSFAVAVAIVVAVLSASRSYAAEVPAVSALATQRFSVEVMGQGPDVILIPGLATPRDVWRPTAEALKTGHRVHLVQIRGFGEPAGINAQGPVIAPFVDELAAYIARNHLRQPAVIGHSLGGLAALMLASRYPGAAGRIMAVDTLPFYGVLIDPAGTADSVRPQAEAMKRAMLAAAEQMKGWNERDCSAVTGDAGAGPPWSVSARGMCQIGNWSLRSDPQVTAEAMVEDATTDMRSEIGRIAIPMTVLYAADTRVRPLDFYRTAYATNYAGAKQARLVPVEGSRHFVMIDQPEATLAAIRDFLNIRP